MYSVTEVKAEVSVLSLMVITMWENKSIKLEMVIRQGASPLFKRQWFDLRPMKTSFLHNDSDTIVSGKLQIKCLKIRQKKFPNVGFFQKKIMYIDMVYLLHTLEHKQQHITKVFQEQHPKSPVNVMEKHQ